MTYTAVFIPRKCFKTKNQPNAGFTWYRNRPISLSNTSKLFISLHVCTWMKMEHSGTFFYDSSKILPIFYYLTSIYFIMLESLTNLLLYSLPHFDKILTLYRILLHTWFHLILRSIHFKSKKWESHRAGDIPMMTETYCYFFCVIIPSENSKILRSDDGHKKERLLLILPVLCAMDTSQVIWLNLGSQ